MHTLHSKKFQCNSVFKKQERKEYLLNYYILDHRIYLNKEQILQIRSEYH